MPTPRSMANEVYDGHYRLRISTGDYREPTRPEASDLIVATHESFAALVRRTGVAPGTVIGDEIHPVTDDHRGPVVEDLLQRLLASGRITFLCGLSAAVEKEKGPRRIGWASTSWRIPPGYHQA